MDATRNRRTPKDNDGSTGSPSKELQDEREGRQVPALSWWAVPIRYLPRTENSITSMKSGSP